MTTVLAIGAALLVLAIAAFAIGAGSLIARAWRGGPYGRAFAVVIGLFAAVLEVDLLVAEIDILQRLLS